MANYKIIEFYIRNQGNGLVYPWGLYVKCEDLAVDVRISTYTGYLIAKHYLLRHKDLFQGSFYNVTSNRFINRFT